MVVETIITLIKVFCAYCIVCVFVPSVALKPLVKNRKISERFMIYLVSGNIYLMITIYIFAYLKRMNHVVLITFLIVSTLLIRYILTVFVCHEQTRFRLFMKELTYLIAKEYGLRLYLYHKRTKFFKVVRQYWTELFSARKLEWIIFLAVTIYNIYYYGYHTMNYVSFAAYDEEVHLYWIQSMISGEIFPAGIYPHGFHNIWGAITVIFQFEAVDVVRVTGVISTTFIMTMLYLGMRTILRSRYAALFGYTVFVSINIYRPFAFDRYQYAIPQEYGMMFLIPMAVFLFHYCKEKKRLDLVLFGTCFSLTLLIHFYVTIIAGVLCVSIGLVYLIRIWKRKLLLPLIITGIAGIVAAVLPLLAGFAMGYEFEQSMSWAASVISGDEENKAADGKDIEKSTQNNKSDGIIVEGTKNQAKKWEMMFDVIYQETERIIEKYVFIDIRYFYIMCIVIVSGILILSIYAILHKEREAQLAQISILLFGFLLTAMLMMRPLGLKNIMEEKRVAIFLAYLTPFFLAIPFELLYLCIKRIGWIHVSYCIGISVFTIFVPFYSYHIGFERPLLPFYYFQYTGTMKTMLSILNDYPDHSWTVVSSVNENSILQNSGFHYELNEFIVNQESYPNKNRITIPTKYVFVVIEKYPNLFQGFWMYPNDERLDYSQRNPVSKELADKEIEMRLDSNVNYEKNRPALMSKAYYWAETYKKYFLDEMNVYYEDTDIIVYRIQQNEYSLNDFAIDYGFNSKTGEKEVGYAK